MELVILRKNIDPWLKSLKGKYQVFDTRKDFLPPKQYFSPPQEDILTLRRKNNKLISAKNYSKNILFGLIPPDLQAIDQLDEIMKGERPDYFYWQKRKNSILIGISEFTLKMKMAIGGDLFLEKINEQEYRVYILTNKGRKLIKDEFFKKIKQPKVKEYSFPIKIALRDFLLDSELLAEAIEWSWESNHEIWDELSRQCLGCGICTYLCPVCHCFSMEDRVTLDDQKCIRCRQWDACTLPEFSQVAGGHNFHKTIKERYYNWYYHKFVRAYRQYGRSQCVACGRCRENCPAGIDIGKVLERIVKDYKKEKQE